MSSKPTPKILARVQRCAYEVLKRDGRVTFPTLFIEMGILSRKNLERWRRGQVPFLERVVDCNLTRLSRIQKALRKVAREQGLRRHLGQRPKCRYSKTNHAFVEDEYRAVYKTRKSKTAKPSSQ